MADDSSTFHGATEHTRRIRALLDDAGVSYRTIEHGPTRTSEASAAARGEPLEVGGKSLVLRVGETFRVCVLSASKKINSNRVRRRFGETRARFATRQELFRSTGLVPGCVPPFGPPILDLPNCLDESFLENDRIAFNAGSLTYSIVMPIEPYLELARPEVFPFAEPATRHPGR